MFLFLFVCPLKILKGPKLRRYLLQHVKFQPGFGKGTTAASNRGAKYGWRS